MVTAPRPLSGRIPFGWLGTVRHPQDPPIPGNRFRHAGRILVALHSSRGHILGGGVGVPEGRVPRRRGSGRGVVAVGAVAGDGCRRPGFGGSPLPVCPGVGGLGRRGGIHVVPGCLRRERPPKPTPKAGGMRKTLGPGSLQPTGQLKLLRCPVPLHNDLPAGGIFNNTTHSAFLMLIQSAL